MKFHSEELQTQVARVLELRQAAMTLKISGRAAFDVVEESVMGETWRCLFGQYRAQFWPDMSFDIETVAKHFGMKTCEATALFGVKEPLSHRMMFIDAHLDELRAKLALAEAGALVESVAA